MLDLYSPERFEPPVSYDELSDEAILDELHRLKEELVDEVLVLGHHYQNDDVIALADERGDSLALAQKAARAQKPYIIFCGVHFMAETADMLTSEQQQVILPDLKAGCTMADMASREQVDRAWQVIQQATTQTIIPITYINCDAQLKAFVGAHGGAICTSSNAHKMIRWALEQGDKLLFFPDQHLGRNTCFDLGIPLEEMVVYNPLALGGGLTTQQIAQARVILWHGHCSVHQGFRPQHIDKLRREAPQTRIIVHPECSFEVVQKADLVGSTSYIIQQIEKAPPGSTFAVGTEINLVNRLNQMFADKHIFSLSPYQCLCTTMYRIRPRWLLQSFRSIREGRPENVIKVPPSIQRQALVALERMLELS